MAKSSWSRNQAPVWSNSRVQRVHDGDGAAARRIRPGSYVFFFVLIALIVFLTHGPLLRLPYYWDELGQFVPASLDLFQTGSWVPYTTLPNVHPPGLMAYLAGFWSVTGYSIPVTRIAMLLIGSLGAFVTFLLAIHLGRRSGGLPAFTALLFLCICPLFVAQAMLVQLDMPAMTFTALALLLFLQNNMRRAALACVVAVMMKETAIIAPMTFGFWLLLEKRWREALLFTAPLVPLGIWLAVLYRSTGHLFGNAAFTQYNLVYTLHPVRLALALLRRLYYLFIGSGHWIGWIAIAYAWRHTSLFRDRSWKVIATFIAGHIVLISVFGGAVLERYLMPILPVLYIAFSIGLAAYSTRDRMISTAGLMACLALASFVNPPYPFPFENNLAFASFVSLHERAAEFVQVRYPTGKIVTTFPLAGALRRPEFGFVSSKLNVREVDDFRQKTLAPLAKEQPDALVLYSVMWDPLNLARFPAVLKVLHDYYDYEPQASSDEVEQMLQMRSVARWNAQGQWIEVFESTSLHPPTISVSARP